MVHFWSRSSRSLIISHPAMLHPTHRGGDWSGGSIINNNSSSSSTATTTTTTASCSNNNSGGVSGSARSGASAATTVTTTLVPSALSGSGHAVGVNVGVVVGGGGGSGGSNNGHNNSHGGSSTTSRTSSSSSSSNNNSGMMKAGGHHGGGGGGGGGGHGGGGGESSGNNSTGGTGGSGGGGGGGGLCLLSRFGQYKRRQHEQHKRRVAEKELDTLHHRIDKLLAKMEEPTDAPLDDDEECVVCLGARATMQTFPCEHRVVCRKCFIRTIQVAVAQRSLPLRCVVCRTRILKLRHAASGSTTKAVSVSAGSPFHSSSAPPAGKHQGNHGHGFLVSSNNSNNNNNNSHSHGINHSRITSLGKVSPCRPTVAARNGMRPASSSSVFGVPDLPRVTLTKSRVSSSSGSQFSPLAKSSRTNQRDSSPSVPYTTTSAKMTSSSSSTTAAMTSVKSAASGTKSPSANKKGDIISDFHAVPSKGNNIYSSKRGRVFPFKPLFWRQ